MVNDTEKLLSQKYFDTIKGHVLDPREMKYILNDIYSLRDLNNHFFWYQINESVKGNVNDIQCKGKINWHNKCKCGNYILHAEPIYPRRALTSGQKYAIMHDMNLRYLMRVRNICYTCAQKRLGKGLFLQEV